MAQSGGGYKALVCLNLTGGCDGNNMLIPADQSYAEYALGRGPLALGRTSLAPMNAASSGRLFGANPSLTNVTSLFNSGNAAWLANAGPLTRPLTKQSLLQGAAAPMNLYDHPFQIAEWQSAVTSTSSVNGWAGRIADVMASQMSGATVPMVISTSGWSLLGTGANTLAASVGTGGNSIGVLNALQSLLPAITAMEKGDASNHLHQMMSSMQSGILQTTSQLNQAYAAGSSLKTVFPATSIGQQLQAVASLIKGRSTLGATRQIFVCTDDGIYDNHIDQINLQGQLLTGLDAAIGAFASAMNELGLFDQVTLFTMTDFARTLQANGSGGSDHAWGNHHLIVGGAVKGGDVYGTFPSLALGGDDDTGSQGAWIPTTSGSQYAATFAKWLGMSASDNASIFPELSNFSKPTLGFL
jgi:uncharacterized protein (DUF1501 family)